MPQRASRRSILYVPGSNARALQKAMEVEADAIIFDLEDSVAPSLKIQARENVMAAMASGNFDRFERIIRINAATTEWGEQDLATAAAVRPDAILVPKVSRSADLPAIQERIDISGGNIAIWAMIETPLAMGNLYSIAATAITEAPALSALVIGTNDLVKDMRMHPPSGRTYLLPLLVSCVAAARAYGLAVIDGVHNNLDDEEGFLLECEEGRALGMDGKSLIHPRQIAMCNRIFSATPEDIAWAKRIVGAFEEPQNRDAGVLRIDGQMVERLHLEMAQRVLGL